ncbi:type II toxin-antitoxin system PemK/MazF family toxin [Helicobacter brantae]|uniref:type II toxin-antitoxin system PemK/MazF family toxin n=1 Tax=Helicobacter brantae TaxID=375927 RepID=UPI001FE73E85|nr:type II toxin-antitoxin system PemK/MazF family toxin [Helicobacter brantae]
MGSEVYGKGERFARPVLVLNVLPNGMFMGVPLSSKTKNKTGFMFYKFKDNQKEIQVALLAQVKSFDKRRVYQYKCSISQENLKTIKERIAKKIIEV